MGMLSTEVKADFRCAVDTLPSTFFLCLIATPHGPQNPQTVTFKILAFNVSRMICFLYRLTKRHFALM